MSDRKRIGILTSGGDCSGLNSIIRAAFIRTKGLGYELFGFKHGLRGLASKNPEYVVLDDKNCDESMLSTAGSLICSDTVWMSSTIESGKTIDDIKKMIYKGYEDLSLSGLICVGGDGSLCLINELLIGNEELKIVVVPKTIDNDVNNTDFSIGFYTALEIVVEAIENVRSTAKSHERVMVVEVMGRDAGFIAMYAGIASGADIILVPEFEYDIEKVKQKVMHCFKNGKNYCIVVVSESVEAKDFKHDEEFVNGVMKYSHLTYKGIGQHLVSLIKETGLESRCITLGHTQRGGRTSINDRLLGTLFGIEAVNLIDRGDCGKLLIFSGNRLKSINVVDAMRDVNKFLTIDDECVKAAKALGVYVGEV
ncbi:MAG: ATP-dependent 6-phosphofructokinase [Holosporales bacterium]|nr:ATP-dependent 6-phosphofructokinase [Holosporales bacterium]